MTNQRNILWRAALLLFFQSAAFIAAFQLPTEKVMLGSTFTNNRDNTIIPLSMGLYEDDEIDWDADLFGQIGKSSNKQVAAANGEKGAAADDALDDSNWGMVPSKSSNSNVKSMREQMKKSWGGEGVKKDEEGKPTADWMPGLGKNGPDEDEPWFTG